MVLNLRHGLFVLAALGLVGCEADPHPPAEPAATTAANPPAAPAAPGLRQRLPGTWRGEVFGEMAKELEVARLTIQEAEPTEAEVAELSAAQRATLAEQRRVLAAQGMEAQIGRSMFQGLVAAFSDIGLTATDNQMTLSLGGEAKQSTYEVLSESGEALRIRISLPSGESMESTLTFAGTDTFTIVTEEGDKHVEMRFIRQ